MTKKNPVAEAVDARLSRSISVGTFGARLNPDANVPGSTGSVYWHDDDRITYSQDAVEEQAIRAWLTEFIGRMIVGHKIEIVNFKDRDGMRVLWFRRQKKKPAIKIPKRRK